MTPERAERLRESIASTPELADAVVQRLQFIEPNGAATINLARRSRTIAAALDMVIANADIAEEIRQTLSESSVPVVGDLKNATLAARVRTEMLDAIRDSATTWDDQLAEDWADVIDTVAGAIFVRAA